MMASRGRFGSMGLLAVLGCGSSPNTVASLEDARNIARVVHVATDAVEGERFAEQWPVDASMRVEVMCSDGGTVAEEREEPSDSHLIVRFMYHDCTEHGFTVNGLIELDETSEVNGVVIVQKGTLYTSLGTCVIEQTWRSPPDPIEYTGNICGFDVANFWG
jgi:hypothetical protein